MVQHNCTKGCRDLVAHLGEVVEHYGEGVIPALQAWIPPSLSLPGSASSRRIRFRMNS